MQRRILVMLMLMTAVAGSGIGKEAFNGPMCVPGDPCGPQQVVSDFERLNGPMCMPGDPFGPGRQ